MSDKEFIERLRKINLVEFARRIGLPVVKRSKGAATNCLFHDDHNPSMSLYQAESGDWRFNCFACQEHGDIFDLVQKLENCDFRSALEKIASISGERLPKQKRKLEPKLDGIQIAQRCYEKQSEEEKKLLKEWATERSFKLTTLKPYSITYSRNQKLSTSINDREEIAALREAGLIFQPNFTDPQQPGLEMDIPYRDTMSRERIIFPIRNEDGVTQGFIGRATRSDVVPKYQFTRGLPKSQLLFGLDVVQESCRKLASSKGSPEEQTHSFLYLVEGTTDVLRLHSLGINALAVMGSDLSFEQANLIERLARSLAKDSISLTLRVFFDGDTAGISATRLSLLKLLSLQSNDLLFGVEVVMPTHEDHPYGGKDPDIWLSNTNKRNAPKKINGAVVSVGHFLMSYGLRCSVEDIKTQWHKSATTQRYAAMRRIDNLLPKREWEAVVGILQDDFFKTSLSEEVKTAEENNWQKRLADYLSRTGSGQTQTDSVEPSRIERESTKMIHAIQVAHCFSKRREFPVDSGSWDRLLAASNVTTNYFIELLGQKDNASNIEPLLGMYVPKSSGSERLKAIPCPEQLSIQQYLLNELLGASIPSQEFEKRIPAVRYDYDVMATTGLARSLSVPVLCFSYQVDMEVIRGEKPPGNEGFFRPYTECWSEFVDYLSRKVQTIDKDPFDDRPFYVARLDVRSYYDTLSRVAIDRVLFEPLLDAIKSLDSPDEFAPSFKPEKTDAIERTRAFIDLICEQSFGYSYFDPSTGDVKEYSDGASVGMPQGPSLSAYLGSVALFGLDETVQSAIDESSSQATYARYVDDMVLITRSKSELDRLRGIIQRELGLIGLELSPKVEPLPPMNAVQVQNWLTANRGLARVSGVTQTPPVVGRPLHDDGSIDRRSALVRLHDPELYNPSSNISTLKNVINGVLNCSEVRFNDQCHVAELVWSVVARQINDDQMSSNDSGQILKAFAKVWTQHSVDVPSAEQFSKWDVLAAVHGLDRFLSRRRFKSSLFDEDQQAQNYAWRKTIAAAVNSGLIESLVGCLPVKDSSLKHILAIHELNILYRVLSITETQELSISETQEIDKRIERVRDISQDYPKSINVTRHIISIGGLSQGRKAVEWLDAIAYGQESDHMLLHEAVVRLSQVSTDSKADPLITMDKRIRSAFQSNSSVLLWTLLSWLPNVKKSEIEELSQEKAVRSFSVLLNIVNRNCSKLLNERSSLIYRALRYVSTEEVTWLPSLPIERIDGFVGYSNNTFFAVRIDELSDKNENALEQSKVSPASKITWSHIKTEANPSFLKASAKSYQLLDSEELDQRLGIPTWIADSFENLVNLSGDGNECPPTALNLLTQRSSKSSENEASSVTNVLGFSIPNYHFDAQGFVRSSTQGLLPQAIYANGSRYWRAGLAITDALNLMGEVFYDPLKSIERPAYPSSLAPKESDYRWAMEKLVRFSLQRLCGRTSNSSRVRETSQVPKSLKRVLERLRSFPESDSDGSNYQALAAVLAAVFETRFAASRFDNELGQDWEQKPGAAVSMLTQISRRVVYTDKQLASRLPIVESNAICKRRNVSAWLSLARRIQELHHELEEGEEAIHAPLLGLCVGLAFNGLNDLFRCLALETIVADEGTRERIASLNPSSISLADWNLDGTELFTYHQFGQREEEQSTSELEILLNTLCRGLAPDNFNQLGCLERITPLGWAVLVGVVTGFLRSDLKLSFLSMDKKQSEFIELFTEVCELLRPSVRENISDEEDADDPWSGFGEFLNDNVFQSVLKFVQSLDEFGESLGLRVSELKSSFYFRIEPTEFDNDSFGANGRTWEVSLNEETYKIEPWRIASASTANEQRNARAENESYSGRRGSTRLKYFWTETRYENEIVSIQLAKPGIADLAGFQLSRESIPDINPVGEDTIDNKQSESSKSEENHESTAEHIEATENYTASFPQKEDFESPDHDKKDWLYLVNRQNNFWKDRGKREGSHYKRIALVQWQVEEFGSYRHPIYECDEESLKSASRGETIGEHRESIEAISYVEHRRRRLLTEVLRACKSFNVDMLLLPEYSTRPETISWLLKHVISQNLEINIWAGTFRFPPFYSELSQSWPNRPPDWSAVLPIITCKRNKFGSLESKIRLRLKKYPAIAYSEVFNPNSDALEAITDSSTQVTELICSEIFLASSPSNLIGLWKTLDELNKKFGKPIREEEAGIQYVLDDIRQFAVDTTMCKERGRRRILFVPAMTPRTVDYAVLGQANFLAAGLTTVFCNDSGPHSHGQSCFIGQDGYDREGCDPIGLPSLTPYHGVTPGLYRPFQPDRGWLGKKEQAVVIADVDPLYQAGGKPRPQNLLPPLKLVAHLPIFEVGKLGSGGTGDYGNMVQLSPPESQDLLNLGWPDLGFWNNQSVINMNSRRYVLSLLLTRLSNHIGNSLVSPNTIRDGSHNQLALLLRALASAVPENSLWLKQRANAYARAHATDPVRYPPPVALDWLYVDLNLDNPDNTKIQVPPLKCPPGDS